MRITEPQKIDAYYQALLERDQGYVGIFYVGVRTTSVFCIATCRARKPKRENVEFFSSFKDALDHGYRPCKICKPTENAFEAPEQVAAAIKLVEENPEAKISDQHLQEQNISPVLVRRWFNQHYGMTFQAYQRMFRVNRAYQELKKGKKATAAAFDSGYDSLSGFGYTFKNLLGNSPRQSLDQALIVLSRLTTPLGPMFMGATDQGICLLEFVDREILEDEFRDLQHRLQAKIILGENQHTRQAKRELEEYFQGTRQSFEVPLHMPGTDFRQSVWQALGTIPYGTTLSYQALSEQIGKPKAIRAVGAANGANRIAIMVPCHRVIGKNGKLTGYGGGMERKRWLLDLEQGNL